MPLIDKREDEVLNLGVISLLTISSILECRIVKKLSKDSLLIKSDEIFTSKSTPDGIYFN